MTNPDKETVGQMLSKFNLRVQPNCLNLSLAEFDVIWSRFSDVQCAIYLGINDESVARFNAWLKSGDDEDAWS